MFKYYYLTFLSLILFFLIPNSVFAYSNDVYREGFEGYTADQSLSSQSSDWYDSVGGYSSILVDDTSPHTGINHITASTTPYSVEMRYGSPLWTYSETQVKVSFDFFASSDPGLAFCYAIKNELDQVVDTRCLTASGWTKNGGGVEYITGGLANDWHNLETRVNCDSETVEIYIDNELATSTEGTYYDCVNIETIQFYTGFGHSGDVYLDNYSFQNPFSGDIIMIPFYDYNQLNTYFYIENVEQLYFYIQKYDVINGATSTVPEVVSFGRGKDLHIYSPLCSGLSDASVYVASIFEIASGTSTFVASTSVDVYCNDLNPVSTDLEDYLTDYDIDSACDNVATSTGSLVSDVRYALECAFRKTGYWFIVPRPEKYSNFLTSYGLLKDSFPFSLVVDSADILAYPITATATPIQIPFFWNGTTTPGVYLFDGQTFVDTYGGDFWDLIYDQIIVFLRVITLMYILFRIYQLAKNR